MDCGRVVQCCVCVLFGGLEMTVKVAALELRS